MKLIRISLKIILLTFFSNAIKASEIPQIVIAPGKNIQSLSTVGTSVTLLDKNDIQKSTKNFIGNFLDESTNSINFFQMGGEGGNMGIQIRGLEKRYSTIYIDGVKMSDPSSPDNSYYLQNISKESIERIEILKGNQSSLYGPNAIGGTIHIFSKKGEQGQKSTYGIKTGSNNSKGLNYSINGANEDLDYFFNFNNYTTDGISAMNDNSEKDNYKNKSLTTNLGYKLKNGLEVRNIVRLVNSKTMYDAVPSTYTDLNDKSDDIEGTYSLKLNYKKNNKISNNISYNKTYIERKTIETENTKQNYFGFRDAINWTSSYNFNLDNRIVYGIEAELDTARYAGDYAPSATGYKKIFKDKKADEQIISEFFDYQLRPHEKLFLTIGLRNDEHSSTGKYQSGRVTSAYKLNKNSIIRTTLGSGIRFPALYDLHFADGNTASSGGGTYAGDGYTGLKVEDIKAERANSFDIGYQKFIDKLNLTLNLNYFNIKLLNPINSDNRNNYKINNTNGVNTSEGLEFSLEYRPIEKFDINFFYTFNNTYDANTCNPEVTNSCNLTSNKIGNAKVRTPRNAASTKMTYYASPEIENSMIIKYVDERRDFGNSNNSFQDVVLDDFTTVDISSKLKLPNNYQLSFLVNNIFNENYELAYQYSTMGRSFIVNFSKIY